MNIRYLLLFLPIFAFANVEQEATTDIVPRVINFVIFAGILYYLFANKVKTYFKDRELEIADKLNSIQDKLRESKNEKELAIKKISEAKESAKSILEVAKKEASLMSDKIKNDLAKSVEHLQKSHTERVEIERSKMNKEVVLEVVDEIFSKDGFKLKGEDLVNIIKKRVA